MKNTFYIFLALLLLMVAYLVFRIIVRRDYAAQGRLSTFSSLLQLAVLLAFFSFPYLYNPPDWALFWKASPTAPPGLHLVGFILISTGMLCSFGTMAWFGIRRAFGIQVKGLKKEGPYRITRNPQLVGGYFMVLGPFLQWPSLYALGWILMFAIIAHWMIIAEEEHLHRIFGKEYEKYCSEVPRYLSAGIRKRGASA